MGEDSSLVISTEDRVEILDILNRFYRDLDVNDIDSVCSFMHPASLWIRQGRELRTSDDIASALRERDPRLHIFHVLSSVTLQALSADHIAYSGYLMVLRTYADPPTDARMPPRGAQSMHVCHGEFKRTTQGWRISAMDAGPPRLLLEIEGD